MTHSSNTSFLLSLSLSLSFKPALDNIVFQLSSNGFFGQPNRRVARNIQDTAYPQTRNAQNVPWLQVILLTLSFVGMIGGLVAVFILQSNGKFLPPHLIVQFDDGVTPALSTYSGLFTLVLSDGSSDLLRKDRVSYWNKIGQGSIGYCADLEAWTFGHSRSSFCDNIMALSENPTTTDISLVLGQPWYVRLSADSERLLPMEDIFSATACSSDLDCGGSKQGTCDIGLCNCKEGHFGLRCNYIEEEVCDVIRVDELTELFTGLRRKVAYEYDILRDDARRLVTAYGHPIYIDSEADSKSPGEAVDVILYTGLRWMLSSIFPPDEAQLYTYFDDEHFDGHPFHASNATLENIEAVTEVVLYDTATDERPAPTSMEWFLPGAQDVADLDPVISIDTVLVCSKCGQYNPCAFGNTCGNNGTCTCNNGETGSLCQVIPVGDGNCDAYFNQQEFGYDGGDCCEASCKSSDTHQCGVVDRDGQDSIPVGFPFCIDPVFGCAADESDCWTQKSKDIQLLITKSSGAFVTLSSNGRTIIVSEPELDTIRVFDQEDDNWVQRGQALEGVATSRFGSLVAISTLPGNVIRRRTGRNPVIIAVAAVGNETNYVEVYRFEPHGIVWQREGQPIVFDNLNDTIDSLGLGSTGPEVVVSVGLRRSNRAYVFKQDDELIWNMAFNTTGSATVVSGDGQTLVCVSTAPPEDAVGSGIFNISSLVLPKPYDARTVNNYTLDNLLPFGTYNFAFQSRPVLLKLSYDASFGVVWGQVYPGSYGLNGLAMIGLEHPRDSPAYITNRLAEVGYDVSEEMPQHKRPYFDMSSDTNHFAINSNGNEIEMFNVESVDGFFDSFRLTPNTSEIPKFPVENFENKFALSNAGNVMAIVQGNRIRVVQRSATCKGTSLRVAITLDEVPGSVSWSLDYVGFVGNISYPTENIDVCRKCYAGDPRYTRVVVVEDFCIPTDKVGCVQLTFSVDGRDLGDGAGFIGLQNGKKFASYSGARHTQAIVHPGGCPDDCPEGTHRLDVLMDFEQGLFPTSLSSPVGTIWSSTTQTLPGIEGEVLIRKCMLLNETSGLFKFDGSGGIGTSVISVDGNPVTHQTFDIGQSQQFEISVDKIFDLTRNIPALCDQDECPPCPVCPGGMVVGPEKVNLGGFLGVQCAELSGLEEGGINPDFCELYPENVAILCACRLVACSADKIAMRFEIEFDKHPSDINVTLVDETGRLVWNLDFSDYVLTQNPVPTFEACVPKEGPLFFSILDGNQDGLCCNSDSGFFLPSDSRGYAVYLDDELLGRREFPFGSRQDLIFRHGTDSSAPELFQPRVWCPDCNPCPVCSGGAEGFNRSASIDFVNYGSINCYDYSVNMSSYIDTDFCTFYKEHISVSCGCPDSAAP